MILSHSFEHQGVIGLQLGRSFIGHPKMTVHIYYVDGLLIDTGQSRMRKHILKATKELPVEHLFISHFHEDHTGNIKELTELHQCQAYAPEMCCQLMKDPPELSGAQKITWGDRPSFHDLIPIKGELRTKNCCFQVIPIPGHAPDMVALFEPNKGWLFSADLYINSYIGYFITDESMMDQINSIRKVLELDFDVMFCCHNPKLKNGKQQLAKKLDFLESFFDEVKSLHHNGYDAKRIFKQMKLKENLLVKTFSGGMLSKMNMVRSVIRDLDNQLVT